MYRKFEALSEDKKLRIMNASLSEFSKKQFKEASTDLIAQNAEISKGALFQYFGTKRQLYLYVFNYSYNVLMNDVLEQIDLENPDILERLKGIFTLKMNLYAKHPDLFEFMVTAYMRESDVSLKEETINMLNGQKLEWYDKIFANIDYTKFRPEFPANQVLSIIYWTLEGYSNTETEKLKHGTTLSAEQYDKWVIELEQYIETLKKAFYKQN